MKTLYSITTASGDLLPVVPSELRSIAILRAYSAGYFNFKVKENCE